MGLFAALILALWQPLPIVEASECPPYTQGYVKDDIIHICPDLTVPREEVIKHEIVHLIQANLGSLILSEETINSLVHYNMPESEVLTVIAVYGNSDYMMEEFEARLLSDLPESVIMLLYRFSESYDSITSSSHS